MEVGISLVTKPFQTKQNSIKNNKTFQSANYRKFWSSNCSIVFVFEVFSPSILGQYLLSTNDICF